MFQHGDAVCRGKGHRAARPALAHHDGQKRHANLKAFGGGPGNRLGLTTLFRALAGIGAGGVDQRDDGQVKPVGHIHQPHGLAIAFGPRHAEIPLDAGFGVMALFMADHDDRLIVEPCQPAHHRMIIGKAAVPGKRGEFGEEPFDIVFRMGPVRVAGDLTFLPWGQGLIKILQQRVGLLVQRFGLFGDVHRRIGAGKRAQLFGLAFDLGERLFKIQIVHRAPFRWTAPIWPEPGQDATRPEAFGPILPAGPDPARSDAPHDPARKRVSWPPCCRA